MAEPPRCDDQHQLLTPPPPTGSPGAPKPTAFQQTNAPYASGDDDSIGDNRPKPSRSHAPPKGYIDVFSHRKMPPGLSWQRLIRPMRRPRFCSVAPALRFRTGPAADLTSVQQMWVTAATWSPLPARWEMVWLGRFMVGGVGDASARRRTDAAAPVNAGVGQPSQQGADSRACREVGVPIPPAMAPDITSVLPHFVEAAEALVEAAPSSCALEWDSNVVAFVRSRGKSNRPAILGIASCRRSTFCRAD